MTMKTETEGYAGLLLAGALLIATRQVYGFESAVLLGILFIVGMLVGIYNVLEVSGDD